MNKVASIVVVLSLMFLAGCQRDNPSHYYITLEESDTRCVVITPRWSNRIQAMSCDWK